MKRSNAITTVILVGVMVLAGGCSTTGNGFFELITTFDEEGAVTSTTKTKIDNQQKATWGSKLADGQGNSSYEGGKPDSDSYFKFNSGSSGSGFEAGSGDPLITGLAQVGLQALTGRGGGGGPGSELTALSIDPTSFAQIQEILGNQAKINAAHETAIKETSSAVASVMDAVEAIGQNIEAFKALVVPLLPAGELPEAAANVSP